MGGIAMSSKRTPERPDENKDGKTPSTPPLKETDAGIKSNYPPGDPTTDAPPPQKPLTKQDKNSS